ncbi:protein-export membrane protein SecG [bacterium BMS3Abin07]|nr:protein-export membrane protein SecG [bacterium BMS3Abin07]GBE32529.1 protein-export membrane protein SecG [bacterium BMS3Bbin05]HDO23432.1 preprotein translocase subunit SecG [Nitrospirota bacterium]HDZ88080.1 preprotein translocase subunit SecG [Nitrospirota bacterium]
MMTSLLTIHILVSIILIGVVLIQGGKGAELGSAFGGGSSQTLFGGRGAATFLSKMTTVVAIIFMLTSLLLAVISVRRGGGGSSSIMDKAVEKTVPSTSGNAAEKAGIKTQKTDSPDKKPVRK